MTRSYDPVINETRLIENIPAKLYVVSLLGRNPSCEWGGAGEKLQGVIHTLEKDLSGSASAGVPHIITTIPHFTRGFRFGDPRQGESETNTYHVGLWDTDELAKGVMRPLDREAIGCLGEIDIFGAEVRLWGASKSVNEYLATFPSIPRLEAYHAKLSHLVPK